MLIVRLCDGKILPAEVKTTSCLDALAILGDGTLLINEEFYILPSDEIELADRLALWLGGHINDVSPEVNKEAAEDLFRVLGDFQPRGMYA